jgi:integral membrane sensor domain MASE1
VKAFQRDATAYLIVAAFGIVAKYDATDFFLDQELNSQQFVQDLCHTCLTGAAILMITDDVWRIFGELTDVAREDTH